MKKTKFCGAILTAVLLAMPLATLAADGPREARRERGPERGPSLEREMGQMGRSLKALSQDVKDPAKSEAALQDLQNLETAAVIAKGILPPLVQHKSGEEKAKAATEYRSDMIKLLKTILDTEQAVTDKQFDHARQLVGQMVNIEKQGHAEFRGHGR